MSAWASCAPPSSTLSRRQGSLLRAIATRLWTARQRRHNSLPLTCRMSNHDLIFPYAAHFDEWLTQQGYPHPAVRPGNRLPTFDDIDWALAAYPELEIEPRWSSDDSRSVVEKNQIGYALYFEHLNWKTHMAEPESDFMTVRGS